MLKSMAFDVTAEDVLGELFAMGLVNAQAVKAAARVVDAQWDALDENELRSYRLAGACQRPVSDRSA